MRHLRQNWLFVVLPRSYSDYLYIDSMTEGSLLAFAYYHLCCSLFRFLEEKISGLFSVGDARSNSDCCIWCATGDGITIGLSGKGLCYLRAMLSADCWRDCLAAFYLHLLFDQYIFEIWQYGNGGFMAYSSVSHLQGILPLLFLLLTGEEGRKA